MYTDKQKQLKASFTNFLGVAISSTVYEGDNAKANVISLFTEELVTQGQNEDGSVNMKALKPMLRASIWILKCRRSDMIKEYKETFKSEPPENFTSELDILIESFETYVNKV